MTVRRALVWLKGGGWKFDEPKTPKSRRSIPLTKATLVALRSHKRAQAVRILKLGAAYEKNDLVFASEIGTPYHWRNLGRRHFKKILKDANYRRP